MAKGYLVGHILVHDKAGYEKFKEMSGPVISEYGGKDPHLSEMSQIGSNHVF